MKKITILAVALVAISFASCKKERTCDCTITSTSGSTTSTTSQTVKFEKVSGGDAKQMCQKRTKVQTPSSGTASTDVYDCKLK